MKNTIARPDPDDLVKIEGLGKENPTLLLADILYSESNSEVTASIPLNLVQFIPSIPRKRLVQRLADRIRHAYISLKDLTEELQDEGHEQLAETLRELKFANVPALRSGELAEIIATDLLRNAGYIVPIERLRFNLHSALYGKGYGPTWATWHLSGNLSHKLV